MTPAATANIENPYSPKTHNQHNARFSAGVERLHKGLTPLTQSTDPIQLRRIALVTDDLESYVVADSGSPRTFRRDFENRYPGRFAKCDLKGKEALDSFFAEGDAFSKMTDEQVFEEARAFAAEGHFTGNALRQLSIYVQLGLLARRGALVRAWEL